MTSFYVRSIEHSLNADHPIPGKLIIAANLTASYDPTTRVASQFRGNPKVIIKIARLFDVSCAGSLLTVTNVSSQITTSPALHRSKRRRRCLNRHIGSEGRRTTESGSDTSNENSFHVISSPESAKPVRITLK